MKQQILRLPHPEMKATWNNESLLSITVPWMSLNIAVTPKEKPWIQEASLIMHKCPEHSSVQKFLANLEKYPLFYTKARSPEDFDKEMLETTTSPLDLVDFSSPESFLKTAEIPFEEELRKNLPKTWKWPANDILEKAKILGTELYDPMSFNTYLSLIRLSFAGNSWEGSGGIQAVLQDTLKKDEALFFRCIGWCATQSYYLTSRACSVLNSAVNRFPKLRNSLKEYLADESGHHKFLENVLERLDFNLSDFEVAAETKFFVNALNNTANRSALAFVNLVDFSEGYSFYEEDPMSILLKQSSKPEAGKGYAQHYEINSTHDHSAIGLSFSRLLAAQRKEDCLFSIRIYELSLHLLNRMEESMKDLVVLMPTV